MVAFGLQQLQHCSPSGDKPSDEGSGPIKGCNLKSGWRIVADCIALQCALMAIDIGGDLAAVE